LILISFTLDTSELKYCLQITPAMRYIVVWYMINTCTHCEIYSCVVKCT